MEFTKRHTELTHKISRWSRQLWDTRANVSADLFGVRGSLASQLYDADRKPQNVASDHANAFCSEVFDRLYGDPDKLEQRHNDGAWAEIAHATLDKIPDWNTLRQSVAGDPDLAALAAKDVIGSILPQMEKLIEEVDNAEQQQQQQQQQTKGSKGNGEPVDIDHLMEVLEQSEGDAPSTGDKVRAVMRRACMDAQDSTNDRRVLLGGICPGMDEAPPTQEQPDPARMQLAEQLKDNDHVREIMERAGRLRRVNTQDKKERNVNAREEVVGIERGSDLGRVLPAQLAGMGHPLMRKITLLGIVENSLMQYRLEGNEPMGRGPIVVMLDESGSMFGHGHTWARAVALACLGIAAKESRAVTVVGFNGYVTYTVHVDERGKSEHGNRAGVALFVASQACDGGTNFDRAFDHVLALGQDKVTDERADLIFVTDGQCNVRSDILETLGNAKADGLRVFGVTVNGGSTSGAVQDLCDSVVDIDAATDPIGAIATAMP